MPLAALIPLIIQYGLPLAQVVWTKATSGKELTQADWDEMNAVSVESPGSHLSSVARHLGLPMTDPKIVALAELIK